MPFTLYEAIVPPFQKMLSNLGELLNKAEAHCAGQGVDPKDIIEARLAPDMFPFAYQVKSASVHSLGAIDGVRNGVFTPDTSLPGDSFASLRERLTDAIKALGEIDRDEINALVGRSMRFEMRGYHADYTAEEFLLTFSYPNFYFHAATAYDILRAKGLALGKVDYLGRIPLKK